MSKTGFNDEMIIKKVKKELGQLGLESKNYIILLLSKVQMTVDGEEKTGTYIDCSKEDKNIVYENREVNILGKRLICLNRDRLRNYYNDNDDFSTKFAVAHESYHAFQHFIYRKHKYNEMSTDNIYEKFEITKFELEDWINVIENYKKYYTPNCSLEDSANHYAKIRSMQQ